MKLNPKIALALVLFGGIRLGLSLWDIGYIVFARMLLNRFNDLVLNKEIDTACLSSIFSIITIGFGIYNWKRALLLNFGIIGVICSLLVIVPLLPMTLLVFLGMGEYIPLIEKLFVSIVCANALFIAAITVGLRNPVRK